MSTDQKVVRGREQTRVLAIGRGAAEQSEGVSKKVSAATMTSSSWRGGCKENQSPYKSESGEDNDRSDDDEPYPQLR